MSGTNVGAYVATIGSSTDNASVGSINFAEGQAPSTLNDSCRVLMADIRTFANVLADGWVEYGDGSGVYTATYVASTQFKFSGVDLTSKYHVGRRVRVVAATPGTIYGTITVSAFGTDTTLTCSWDSSSLSNEAITSVHLGPAFTNTALPASQSMAGLSGTSFPITPQGRLTLTTATPVMTATTSAQTTIYYTPYVGGLVPIYDGTRWTITPFAELSQTTTDNTKSPAAVANGSVYDMFVWSDSGTLRCTRGPAWSNDTTRGYTLTLQNGIYLNTSAITNGPGASRGTWVGTVRSNGSAQIDWIYGALAAGGTAAFFGVWNAYNRVNVATMVQDSTDLWSLAAVSIRSANNSTTMRVTMVRGANEDGVFAMFGGLCSNASGPAVLGIGLDSTSAFSGKTGDNQSLTLNDASGFWTGLPGLGVHYIQALESAQTAGTANFYGDAGLTYVQNGLAVQLRA